MKTAAPSKELEELRRRFQELSKEYDEVKSSEAQTTETLQKNNSEIARLQGSQKKEKTEHTK